MVGNEVPRPMALLTLVRHAETMANVERVLQGVCDAPLSSRGVKQIEQLERAWRPVTGDAPQANLYELPRPTLIVTSPIGRAKSTANAIARGCGVKEVPETDSTTFRSAHLPKPKHTVHDTLQTDAGLSERNFGKAECTRKQTPVPGYTRLPTRELGRAESENTFRNRVGSVGAKWIEWLQGYGSEEATKKEDEAVTVLKNDTEAEAREGTDATSELAAQGTDKKDSVAPGDLKQRVEDVAMPHLVLVTHGQWINAFLKYHMSCVWQNADQFYVQSANTGLFTLGVYPSTAPHTLRLLRRNDTRHLDDGTQTRPIKRGRRDKAPPQRTTLTEFWK